MQNVSKADNQALSHNMFFVYKDSRRMTPRISSQYQCIQTTAGESKDTILSLFYLNSEYDIVQDNAVILGSLDF